MLESLTVLHARACRQGALDREDAAPPAHDRHAVAPLAGGAHRAHRARPARRGPLAGGPCPSPRSRSSATSCASTRTTGPRVERIETDPRAMTLRYEDLVTEPERELRRVCAFVGEAYEPAMLDARGQRRQRRCRPRMVEGVGRGAARRRPAWGAGGARCRPTCSVSRRCTWPTSCASTATRAHGAPQREVAVVPVGDAVGPSNERLLLELARRDTVVVRPAPADAGGAASPARARLPRRARAARPESRAGSRPGASSPWSPSPEGCSCGGCRVGRSDGSARRRCAPRQPRDAAEVLVVLLLRVLARQVSLDEAWTDLPPHSPHAR